MVLRKVLIVYQLITLVFLFGTWDRLILVLVLGRLIKKKFNKFTVWSVYNRFYNHRLMKFR